MDNIIIVRKEIKELNKKMIKQEELEKKFREAEKKLQEMYQEIIRD